MLAAAEQVAMMNYLSTAITHAYLHVNKQVWINSLNSCPFRPPKVIVKNNNLLEAAIAIDK